MQATGDFEVTEGDTLVVKGRITANDSDLIIPEPMRLRNHDGQPRMEKKDIYKELKLRGYDYTGEFQGLMSASLDGKN